MASAQRRAPYPWGTIAPRQRLRLVSASARKALDGAKSPGFGRVSGSVSGAVRGTALAWVEALRPSLDLDVCMALHRRWRSEWSPSAPYSDPPRSVSVISSRVGGDPQGDREYLAVRRFILARREATYTAPVSRRATAGSSSRAGNLSNPGSFLLALARH